MERKLASVRKINNIHPILGADAIETATVDGWEVVVKKGEFQVGMLAVYFEIDSWIPNEIAPFLTRPGHHPKVYNGVEGQRLKTIRLRGQLSQGLLLPICAILPSIYWRHDGCPEGTNLTEPLNIQKWEKPLSVNLMGMAKGNFPSFIQKTDEERCQNILDKIFRKHVDEEYEVTLKLDGSSMTVFHYDQLEDTDEIVGVCSRNLRLKLDQEGNTFVNTAKNLGLIDALYKYGLNIALQGELMGPGIQGNREGLTSFEFHLFNIWDIDQQCYVDPLTRGAMMTMLEGHGARIIHAPIVEDFFNLSIDGNISTVKELLEFAKQPSINNPVAEGLVFKSYNSNFSFKVINNEFLLQEK